MRVFKSQKAIKVCREVADDEPQSRRAFTRTYVEHVAQVKAVVLVKSPPES